jgi:hypothetical protein
MTKQVSKTELERLSQGGDAWESGELGSSAEHAKLAPGGDEKRLDDALGLQLISIRLSKSLIDKVKALAAIEEIGYQPLIRKVLETYTKDNEYKLRSKTLPTTQEEIESIVEERDQLRKQLSHVEALASAVTEFGPCADLKSEIAQLKLEIEENCHSIIELPWNQATASPEFVGEYKKLQFEMTELKRTLIASLESHLPKYDKLSIMLYIYPESSPDHQAIREHVNDVIQKVKGHRDEVRVIKNRIATLKVLPIDDGPKKSSNNSS